MSTPRSLFIVSLPRSMSTFVHELCCRALGIRAPAWVDAGELLNGDRMFLYSGSLPHFLTADDGSRRMMWEFLDDMVQPVGRVYKDVVQPLIVSPWLAEQHDLAKLILQRSLTDVAWAMLRNGWRFPERVGGAVRSGDEPDDRFLRGLLCARQAVEQLRNTTGVEVIDYDQLLTDEHSLLHVLSNLYPHLELAPLDYFTDDFKRQRDKVLARRLRDDWRRLDQRLQVLDEETL